MLTTETHKLLLKATNSSCLKKLASGILFKKKKKWSNFTQAAHVHLLGGKVVSFKMVRSLCARVQVCLPGPVLIFKSSPIDLVFVNE